MKSESFKNKYLGSFELSTYDSDLIKAAIEYEESCEAYDKIVCSAVSPRDGSAMPINHWELRLVNSNAVEVMKGVLRNYPHLTAKDIRKKAAEMP